MSVTKTSEPRPLLPLVLLHLVAALICFSFFTSVPIAICLICMAIGNDLGGPMFFPMFVMGVVLVAAGFTALIASAALACDLLRRRIKIPVWLPSLVIFLLVAISCWLFLRESHWAIPPILGCVVALAFTVHWAAISSTWWLSRSLFRFFRTEGK